MTALATGLLFAGRDFRVVRTYRLAFVMSVASAAMSLVTFRFISDLVGDAEAVRATGDYFAFVVVGMVLAVVLDGALSGPAGAVRQEQVQGTLEVLATQPLSPAQLAVGWCAYPVLRGLGTGAVSLSFAGILGLRLASADWVAAGVVIVLSSVVFAALGIVAASFVMAFQQGGGLTAWISSGLALASGVYFPLSLFPAWVGTLAEASPLTHAVRALRGSLLQGAGFGALRGDLAALAIAAAVLVPAALAVFARAIAFARARGTIATY